MKLKKEDYLKIAKFIEEGKSYIEIAAIFRMGKTNIHNLVRRYQMHGADALCYKGNWRNFTPEFKEQIVNKHYSGCSISSLAIECNVSYSNISSWIKKYEQLGYNGLIDNRGRPGVAKMGRPRKNDQSNNNKKMAPLTDAEREELNELRKRTQRLEMEIEATKKLNALVQARIERETQKKRK
jgi:transposase